LEPLVRSREGRIVKVMGDGVLIEFASAVNAVEAALELQHEMGKANMGLNEDRFCVSASVCETDLGVRNAVAGLGIR
jgi:class 3 adenylate cyclase